MKKEMIMFALGAVAVTGLSDDLDPQISNVRTQSEPGRTVTVSYELDAPAIVTMNVLTNGVSIGYSNITHVAGDCHKVVGSGSHTIKWYARKSWPDHRFDEPCVTVELTAWATNVPPDVMVVDLGSGLVEYFPSIDSLEGGIGADIYKTQKLVLKKVHAGMFSMGSPASEVGRTKASERASDADRQVPVRISKDFYLGVYECTQRQYQLIKNENWSYFNNPACYAKRPAESVSWYTLRGGSSVSYWPDERPKVEDWSFFGALRGLTGNRWLFDLPTEAQWEYACRAGTTSALPNGRELTDATVSTTLNPLARYKGNGGYVGGSEPAQNCDCSAGTDEVGMHEPNSWGFYDMLGNVREWCLNLYTWEQESYPYPSTDIAVDPLGHRNASTGSDTYRYFRGGGWKNDACECRSATRGGTTDKTGSSNIGFRVCVTLD